MFKWLQKVATLDWKGKRRGSFQMNNVGWSSFWKLFWRDFWDFFRWELNDFPSIKDQLFIREEICCTSETEMHSTSIGSSSSVVLIECMFNSWINLFIKDYIFHWKDWLLIVNLISRNDPQTITWFSHVHWVYN